MKLPEDREVTSDRTPIIGLCTSAEKITQSFRINLSSEQNNHRTRTFDQIVDKRPEEAKQHGNIFTMVTCN